MLGFFRKKEIDTRLLKQNITDVVIEIWQDPSMLPFEKFNSFVEYGKLIKSEKPPSMFYREKLRYTLCVAMILLFKIDAGEEDIAEIIEEIKNQVHVIDAPNANSICVALGLKAHKYTEIRFATNAKSAGKAIERRFSEEAFGFCPSDDDVDRRYTLYKTLSSFERDSIFKVSAAIRKSKV